MKIQINKNNLLTIFNENIPQTKEYTYNVSGYTFSDFDTGIIVLHKKEWKIINLKNLGENMSVVYLDDETTKAINKEGIEEAIELFEGFDENTGEKYYFIPGLGEAQQKKKNRIWEALGIRYIIQKTTKGMTIEGTMQSKKNSGGFIFGLLLIYGKFEGKHKELASIKIQVPLFGQYMKNEEIIDKHIMTLQKAGIFLKTDKLMNKNGMVYQISCNDYELLHIFAKRYEPVEKFEKITKRDFTQEMKEKLIEFLETNPEIPSEGKNEVIKKLKSGTMKLLTK